MYDVGCSAARCLQWNAGKIRLFHLFQIYYYQSAAHPFICPCILNASIRTQPTVTFSTGMNTPVAVEERLEILWRPNVFKNLCQLKDKKRMIYKQNKRLR